MSEDLDKLLDKLKELGALYSLRTLAAIAILVIGWLAVRGLREVIRRLLLKARLDPTLVSFVSNLAYFAGLAFVIIAALGQIGVQTASLVALLGAAGLAVGLALQGSLANFAAGLLLIIFKPFKVGDFIEGGGVSGVVEEVGIFTAVLRTPDNKKIIVPNAKMTGDNIVNYTARDIRRVDLVAGVSYREDLDKVRRVLTDLLAADSRILKDPAPTIGVLALAESSVNFAVRPWVKTADYWDVFFATQESIKKRFDAEGISIPFPQRDVHLHQAD